MSLLAESEVQNVVINFSLKGCENAQAETGVIKEHKVLKGSMSCMVGTHSHGLTHHIRALAL